MTGFYINPTQQTTDSTLVLGNRNSESGMEETDHMFKQYLLTWLTQQWADNIFKKQGKIYFETSLNKEVLKSTLFSFTGTVAVVRDTSKDTYWKEALHTKRNLHSTHSSL